MASGNSTIGRKNPYQVFCPFASAPQKNGNNNRKKSEVSTVIYRKHIWGWHPGTHQRKGHSSNKSVACPGQHPTVPTVRAQPESSLPKPRKFGWDPNKAALPGRRKAEESWNVKMRAGMIPHQAPKLVHKIWICIPQKKMIYEYKIEIYEWWKGHMFFPTMNFSGGAMWILQGVWLSCPDFQVSAVSSKGSSELQGVQVTTARVYGIPC